MEPRSVLIRVVYHHRDEDTRVTLPDRTVITLRRDDTIRPGITGLVAERWAAAREARDAALQAINAELRANAELLRTPAFGEDPNQPLRRTVYPRLHLSAVDAAVAGGSVSSARDVTLVRGLHAWRNQGPMIRLGAAIEALQAQLTPEA